MAEFNQVSYAFEKIFEEIRGDSPRVLGSWAVDHLRESLDDFETRLKERGVGVDSYDSIEYLYDEIEHPLTELTKFTKREPSEILSNKSAVVFAEALRTYFDQLRHIAQEIDQEYSSAPEPVIPPEHPHVEMVITTTIIGKEPTS